MLLPDPAELVRTFRNGQVSQAEEAGAYEALVRCREWAFGRRAPPSWLAYGLDLLGAEIEGDGLVQSVLLPYAQRALVCTCFSKRLGFSSQQRHVERKSSGVRVGASERVESKRSPCAAARV